jgi:hypothetical protein
MNATDFAAQFKGLDETDLAKLFGGERARKGVQGLIANLDKLDESRKAQAKRTGETEKAEDKISKTRAHRLKLLESRIQGAKLDIGEAITPLADTLLPVVTDLAKIGGEFASNHPDIIKGAGALGVAAVGFGKIGQGVVGVSRTVGALRSLNNLMGPAAGKIGGLIGKLGPGRLGMVGAALAGGMALGTLIDNLTGFSDWVASFANDPVFEKINTRKVATTQAQIKERKQADITRLDKLISADGFMDKVSGRTASRVVERSRLQHELFRLNRKAESSGGDIGAIGGDGGGVGKPGSTGRPAIDVKVSVEDGRIKVNSVTSSNHEGEVNATTGDGVGLN